MALGHTRTPGAIHRFGTAAEIEAWVRSPPAARMEASLEGLDFYPAETAVFATPDQQLSPTAVVLARLAGPAYDPAWVRESVDSLRLEWDFKGQPQDSVGYFRLRSHGAVVVLEFLATRLGDEVFITPEQRALVVASEALNPVPPDILAEQRCDHHRQRRPDRRRPQHPRRPAGDPERAGGDVVGPHAGVRPGSS